MSGAEEKRLGKAHLNESQVLRLIEIIEDLDPIVIGGQAIYLWVRHYRAKTQAFLGDDRAFTSKDLDFYANRRAAEALADALDGTVLIPALGDATPQAACVIGTLDGAAVEIDFMASVLGVVGRRIAKNYVLLEAQAPSSGRALRILLLHPLDCVRSRLANINVLGRDDEHAIQQAEASIAVLGRFLDELLDEPMRRRHVQGVLRDLSYVIRDGHVGKRSHMSHPQLRPEAVLEEFLADERLDARWRDKILRPSIVRVRRWHDLAHARRDGSRTF